MKKTAIYACMGAILLSVSSITKAGAESIDFDGALKSESLSGFSLASMQESGNMPKVSPAFITESSQENSGAKLRALIPSARKSVVMAVEEMSPNTLNQEDLALLKADSVALVFSNNQAYFATPRAESGDYEIISKTGNTQLLKALNKLQDSSVNPEITTDKNWIIKCRDIIDWIIRIEGGREILVKVVTKVCEEEWATGGGEGGHIAPGSENHARTKPIRGI